MPNKPELPWIPAPARAPERPADWVRGFSIGRVRVDRPFVLAPMSGVTDTAFRRTVQIASSGTVGLLVTEFISIEGLTNDNLVARTRIAFDRAVERPLAVQIFGADIERMVEAARIVEANGADMVDINCGCPAPKVVRRGGGAELMRQPAHLATMVQRCVEAVRIPVTVKMRSGWDEPSINVLDVARACEDAGAAAIAIHPRTRKQLYAGAPRWELVAEVADQVSVPVIGSGDIASAEGALQRLRESGCAGVMIGRAAVMNPWIFGQVEDLVRGERPRVPSNSERRRVIFGFADMMQDYMPEKAVPGRMKQLLARLTKGIDGGMLLRERALQAAGTAELLHWVESYFEAHEDGTVEAWSERARAARKVIVRVPRGVRRRRRAA